MSAIPKLNENPNGLHQRYTVQKTNGEPVDPMATYFILRLDGLGRDGRHIAACRAAAMTYAETILANPDAVDLHQMAIQLRTLIENFDRQGA